MAILYRCKLSNLKKGGKPCYQALVQNMGTVSREEFILELMRLTGFPKDTSEFFLNVFASVLAAYYRQGRYIQLGPLAGGVTIHGSVDNPKKTWEQSGMKLVPYLTAAGDLRNCLAGETGKNVTQGATASLVSVLDTVHAVNWSIIGSDNTVVHSIGTGLEVDATAEDEGVWLENSKGVIVSKADVTASSETMLDCTFAELPESGRYKFVVATRDGLGPEYGVTMVKRWVTVEKEAANG